ncbi:MULTISPECIES: glycosyltransferase family 2 protein [Lactobacillus]|uniref:glycosyltransferase family 2 protein n=1 Tax=Lactobacillus TaxID=1578 RepID=UPI0018DE95F8|nr:MULTISPECIES: glycosyltransferase family 2 protein [unclassified Lactobacillus]MBI0121382.1 glycosyltransferase family 2 protein [Lactobacillus sp. M0398]MBI0123529.1 glycosyltransferase family 2 protein [Lactobacillus sp. W8174]MBI0135841.1 glycosyltransferase family 2 protein [Lactobacillus sp. W8173]
MKKGKLCIVVPCYNEQQVLPKSEPIFKKVIERLIGDHQITETSQVVFVDDGSTDKTWLLIKQYSNEEHVSGLKLSRNFGHQAAIFAGMSAVSDADMVVTIDSDLQDDPNVIIKMVAKYYEGAQVVYGVRNNRQTDTHFKRITAKIFYKLMNCLGVKMIPDAADFRLLSHQAVTALINYPERNLFLRGLVPLIGFPSAKVYYKRTERVAGKSKYPLRKMINLALDGITSFSIVPIRLIMNLGLLIVLIALILLIYTFIQNAKGNTVSGWSSLMISIWALGGVQLICISIIGEYVGKIFKEVKKRPRYTIERDLYHKNNAD